MKMIRELAQSEAAYRSLTRSWFQHSTTLELFRRISDKGYKVIVTTDHGTIRVNNPIKVIGDRNTNTNLRYKVGKNLNYNPKEVLEIRDPEKIGLPLSLIHIWLPSRKSEVFSGSIPSSLANASAFSSV